MRGRRRAFAILHVVPTGLSFITNAVSQYGISRLRSLSRDDIALGLAGVASAIGVAHELHGPPLAQSRCSSSSESLASSLAVPDGRTWSGPDTDRSRARADRARDLHCSNDCSVSPLDLSAAKWQWQSVRDLVGSLSWFLLVSAVAIVLSRRANMLRAYFGAIERFFYLGVFACSP